MPENASPQGGPRVPMIIAGLAIAAIGGYALGWQIGSQQGSKKNYDEGFAAARADANAKLAASGLVGFELEDETEVTSASGTITAINGSSFTLHVIEHSRNPLDDPREYDLTVETNDGTKFVTRTRVSEEEYAASMKQYQAARDAAEGAETDGTLVRPDRFKEIESSMTDLVVGTDVSITTLENFSGKSSATADNVTSMEEPRNETDEPVQAEE